MRKVRVLSPEEAVMMVKDGDVAEDICQETFIKVVRFIDEGRYTDNGKFLSWVMRIAHNLVIDYFRQNKQANKIGESDAGFDLLGSLKFSSDTVEDRMVSAQIESDVRRLVELIQDRVLNETGVELECEIKFL